MHITSELILQVSALINTLLLSGLAYFLKHLHKQFNDLQNEVKGTLISSAVEAQRIQQIERDLIELKQIVMSSLFPSSKSYKQNR